jgi:hypothetical protein
VNLDEIRVILAHGKRKSNIRRAIWDAVLASIDVVLNCDDPEIMQKEINVRIDKAIKDLEPEFESVTRLTNLLSISQLERIIKNLQSSGIHQDIEQQLLITMKCNEKVLEILQNISICIWADNFKNATAKLDTIDELIERALKIMGDISTRKNERDAVEGFTCQQSPSHFAVSPAIIPIQSLEDDPNAAPIPSTPVPTYPSEYSDGKVKE